MKILKISIVFILILLILPFTFYRIKVGDFILMKGECFFELSVGDFLPPRNQIIRGIFEHFNGKLYVKFNKINKDGKYDDTIYFWLTPSEIDNYFGKSLIDMEKYKCRPYAEIRVRSLLNGDYEIISVEKVKWSKELPYSYE